MVTIAVIMVTVVLPIACRRQCGGKVLPENPLEGESPWVMQLLVLNIAKGTTDPGVDYFNHLLWFGLVGLDR